MFAALVAAVIAVVSYGNKQLPHTQAAPPPAPAKKTVVYVVDTTVGGSHYSVRSDCPRPTKWTPEQVKRFEKRCVVKSG
jgi:hypothetical protein